MRENTDQKNSEYDTFHAVGYSYFKSELPPKDTIMSIFSAQQGGIKTESNINSSSMELWSNNHCNGYKRK